MFPNGSWNIYPDAKLHYGKCNSRPNGCQFPAKECRCFNAWGMLRILIAELTQQVAHLQLHILHHLSDVGDVRSVIIHRHILLHLTDHVSTEVQRSKVIAVSAEVQDDGAGELVVGGAGAVKRLEDVYAVPTTGGLAGWRDGCAKVSAGVRIKEGQRISAVLFGEQRDTIGIPRTLLQQHTACKAILHIPQVHARDAALVVPVRHLLLAANPPIGAPLVPRNLVIPRCNARVPLTAPGRRQKPRWP